MSPFQLLSPCLPFADRSIVEKDPFRGLELVSAVQEALHDPSPCVSALGLRALGIMCETEVLDFYKAFKARHKWAPLG